MPMSMGSLVGPQPAAAVIRLPILNDIDSIDFDCLRSFS